MASDAVQAGDARSSGNVFISYNRDDRDFCVQIERLLRDEGYDPKVDVSGIATGEAWEKRLKEMIGGSDTFLVILTDAWVESDNCRAEYVIARDKAKRVISVLPQALKETESATPEEAEVRAALLVNQNIHFFAAREGHGGGFYDGMNELKQFLRSDMDQLRLRRLYEQRSQAWRNGEDDLLSGDQLTQAETWLKKERARKKEPGQESVPPEIETYIAESHKARARAQRAERQRRVVLAGLAGLLLAAGVFLAVQAGRVQEEQGQRRIADADAQRLIDAAPKWAEGKSALAAAREAAELTVGDATAVDDGRETAEWASRFDAAIAQLEDGIRTIRDIEQESAKPLVLEIGLDLATAQFNSGDIAASEQTLRELEEFAAFSPANRRAVHFMASAVIACRNGDDKDTIKALLNAAPEEVIAASTPDMASQWSKPSPTCDAAREAICEVVKGCEENFSGGMQALAPLQEEAEAPAQAQAPEDDARAGLLDGVTPPASQEAITEVFLHISSTGDREAARQVAQALTAMNYRVLGIELIEAPAGRNRSVRYYFEDQRGEAEALIRMCAEIARNLDGKAGWTVQESYRLISLVGRFEGLKPGRVEIWL